MILVNTSKKVDVKSEYAATFSTKYSKCEWIFHLFDELSDIDGTLNLVLLLLQITIMEGRLLCLEYHMSTPKAES